MVFKHSEQESMTFYGGLNTIGGVHILYGKQDTGLIFDLGLALRGMFNESVRADRKEGIRSYLLTRCAPPVPGLYDPELTGPLADSTLAAVWGRTELPSFAKLNVFISHIHQDHMALLPYVRKDVPVYMHEDAYAVYQAVIASGEYEGTQATITKLRDLEEVDFGPYRLQLIEVDHDTPGSSGFILRTGEHTIAFTGDWRRHGRHSARLDRFIDLCRKAEVDLVITEGTRLRPDTLFRKPIDRLELDVAKQYEAVLQEAKGLVYVNILSRNVERVADIIMAAKSAGRKLVMDESTAVFWRTATAEGIRALNGHPALEESDTIRLVRTPAGRELDPSVIGQLPYAEVTMEQLVKSKSDYSVFLTYRQLPLMAELETYGDRSSRSHYVHADGNPLTPSDDTLHRWLTEYSVQYHYLATGGHAATDEISELVQAIRPQAVIPLHSMHPTLLPTGEVPRIFPVYGETIHLERIIEAKASLT
ncbi:MBL fold metallo-hydrolase [Paenibacillus sp. YYML68]|uniref:MBL fold metallo-hydrolase n=1 Tax=Paenibacillus sp. YYML68 TaxID=2909250 RepID=UPI002491F816|nr:MBL fold metallo-hydrolase [Paenibacillus sp. YYML68]